jgi:hypothetical protein
MFLFHPKPQKGQKYEKWYKLNYPNETTEGSGRKRKIGGRKEEFR